MAGFATGFHTGASVIERGQRAQREQEAHDLLQQARAIDLANAQLTLDSNLQLVRDNEAIREAAATITPSAGQQLSVAGGGNQFFSDPKAAAMAAEQERTIAEMTAAPAAARPGEQLAQGPAPTPAWAAGGQVFGDQAAALAAAAQGNSLNARRERVASELLNQGRITEAAELTEKIAKSRDEGVLRMLDVIAAGGDGNAAKEAFNRMGTERMGPNDEVRVVRRFNLERPGYDPIPTAEVQIVRNGQVVQHIPDIVSLRHLADKQLEMAKQGYQAKRDEKADDRAERQVQSLVDYREAAGRAAEARAAAAGGGGGAGGAGPDSGVGLTLGDRDKVHKTLNDLRKDLFDPKQALSPEEAEDIRRQGDLFAEQTQTTVDLSFGAGVPITAYEAQIAVGVRDPARLARTQDPNTGAWYEVAHVNGRWIPRRRVEAPPQPAGDDGDTPGDGDAGAPAQDRAPARAEAPPTNTPQPVGDPDKPLPPGISDKVDDRAKRLMQEREDQAAAAERQRKERDRQQAELEAELDRKREEVAGLTRERIEALPMADVRRIYRDYRDVLSQAQWSLLRRRMQ